MDYDEYDYYYTSSFEQIYRCYSVSSINKPHLETGDKIIMPPSALNRLAYLHIEYPMLFEICNSATGRVSHCGVLEFIAEEGTIYMPNWMMQNMQLEEGNIIQVKNATLPKGSYIKLQPHTKCFLDITNPKAILETTLRSFSCLTTGDTIRVAYNNKQYYIDIVEVRPSYAVSIIETDCEVDFAPPLDYVEPERPPVPASVIKSPTHDEEVTVEAELKFTPFTGVGRRLDGNPSNPSTSPTSSSTSKDSQFQTANGAKPVAGTTSQKTSHQASGKLVFGSNSSSKGKKKAPQSEANAEPPKKEETKFQAFTGRKYSLMG